ncbi:hypothetical protein Bbelb_040740 [Branchiostoma belcheri]|nr:hypothetical protein Bbelb_040740 [Branchiostoma belcheri]
MHREQLHSPRTAIQHYKQALALARQLKDRHREGVACNRLGLVHCAMEEYESALEWFQRYLQIRQEDGNKEQITAHTHVGDAYRLLGKLDLAATHFNTALQMAQQTGDQHEQMEIYFKMGEMHREQLHSPRTAIQHYEQVLALARQLKDRHEEGVACDSLGLVHWDMEEYESALEWFQKYLKISQEDGNKGQITAHTNVGYVYSVLGKLELATSHFNTALQMAQQTGDQHGQMEIYFKMGDMHREQLHSPRTAIQHYEQALALARQLKDRHEERIACNRLGLVHYVMGEYGAALEWDQKHLQIVEKDGNKEEQTAAHTHVGNVYRRLGKLDLATSHFNTALQLAQQTGDQHGQMEVYFEIGEMHREELHSPRTAIQYYDEALALVRQLKNKHHEGVACERLEWLISKWGSMRQV